MPIVLCGCKSDKRGIFDDEDVVTTEQGIEMQKKLRFYQYVECSARMKQNLSEVFTEAVSGAIEIREKKKELMKGKKSVKLKEKEVVIEIKEEKEVPEDETMRKSFCGSIDDRIIEAPETKRISEEVRRKKCKCTIL